MEYIYTLTLLLLSSISAINESQDLSDSTELLKTILLSREEQVTSFTAEYTLEQKGYGDNKDVTWEHNQELRC